MKISLFCNAGMSTSLVALKLKQYFEKEKRTDVEVEAYDFSSMLDEGPSSDLIILAPQVSWAVDDVQRDYPDKPCLLLTMQEFGSMNGEVIGKRIDEFLNNEAAD